MEARMAGSDLIRRSKLHLVDLAGSERVGKTNSSGSVLTEAKYINSSLFFLEMVIVALYEKATKGRQHIPYRNSMMTSVLRYVAFDNNVALFYAFSSCVNSKLQVLLKIFFGVYTYCYVFIFFCLFLFLHVACAVIVWEATARPL
jgi:hypothetical protein